MPLPDRPSLEFLKKLAKDTLRDLRRTDAGARLADAQRVVARRHGFTSWGALRAQLDAVSGAGTPDRTSELFDAIKRGDGASMSQLLDADPALAGARDADGQTPLLAAVDAHRANLIPRLLSRGADPHAIYAHSAHTPLSWAVTAESFEAAQALLRAGVEPDLFCAAGLGDVERVRGFFAADGRLKPGASRTGSSRYAADGARLPCPPGSDAEIVADALYIACRTGRLDVVRELLTRGPDLSFRGFAGATALHWAYFAGARAVAALLVRHGADPTLRDPVLGCTPEAFGICAPSSWGWVSKVRQRLAEDRSLVHAVSARGGPLHDAAHAGVLEAVKALLDAGADAGRRNAQGQTALDVARARPAHAGCVAVVEWLERSAPEPRRL